MGGQFEEDVEDMISRAEGNPNAHAPGYGRSVSWLCWYCGPEYVWILGGAGDPTCAFPISGVSTTGDWNQTAAPHTQSGSTSSKQLQGTLYRGDHVGEWRGQPRGVRPILCCQFRASWGDSRQLHRANADLVFCREMAGRATATFADPGSLWSLVRADRIYWSWSLHFDLVMARYKRRIRGEAGRGVAAIQTWVRAFPFRLELISQA
jgi:hypothetical protein